jgi:hypothetical protein
MFVKVLISPRKKYSFSDVFAAKVFEKNDSLSTWAPFESWQS